MVVLLKKEGTFSVADHKHTMAVRKTEPSGISKNVFFLSIAIMAVVGFVAGTRSNELLAAVGPMFGIKIETGTLNLAAVQTTYQELKANYDGELNNKTLEDGAIRGMVAAAGDEYTVFMDKEEASSFNDDLSGQIGGGIGAEIGVRAGKPTILRVLADNPAEKAGVRAGDIIISVNDQPSLDWNADRTAKAVRGEVDTTVKLVVLRATEQKEFTLTRKTVTNPSVDSSVSDGIGLLTLTRFDNETGKLARAAAQRFKQQNVKGIVLDLRGNGGGYLTAAQEISGLWLNNKVVVTERAGDKVIDELRSGADAILAGIPTVVLVDGSSASASEIVAGALQDHNAATLVGEKTYGKGTVQKVLDLGAGTQLKVTVARWYTPKGKNITKEGISPNQQIELTPEDVDKGNDPQLQAAKARLSK